MIFGVGANRHITSPGYTPKLWNVRVGHPDKIIGGMITIGQDSGSVNMWKGSIIWVH